MPPLLPLLLRSRSLWQPAQPRVTSVLATCCHSQKQQCRRYAGPSPVGRQRCAAVAAGSAPGFGPAASRGRQLLHRSRMGRLAPVKRWLSALGHPVAHRHQNPLLQYRCAMHIASPLLGDSEAAGRKPRSKPFYRTPVSAKPGFYAKKMKTCQDEGKHGEVFRIFEDMQRKQIRPDLSVYNHVLSSCAAQGRAKMAFQLYNDLKKDQLLEPDAYTVASVFKVFAVSTTSEERAQEAIRKLRDDVYELDIRRNTFLYNAMLNAMASRSMYNDLFETFTFMSEEVDKEANALDPATVSLLIRACRKTNDFDRLGKVYELATLSDAVDERVCSDLIQTLKEWAVAYYYPVKRRGAKGDPLKVQKAREMSAQISEAVTVTYELGLSHGLAADFNFVRDAAHAVVYTGGQGEKLLGRLHDLLSTCDGSIAPRVLAHVLRICNLGYRHQDLTEEHVTFLLQNHATGVYPPSALQALGRFACAPPNDRRLRQFGETFGADKLGTLCLRFTGASAASLRSHCPNTVGEYRSNFEYVLRWQPTYDFLLQHADLLGREMDVTVQGHAGNRNIEVARASVAQLPEGFELQTEGNIVLATSPTARPGYPIHFLRKKPPVKRTPFRIKGEVVYKCDNDIGRIKTITRKEQLKRHIDTREKDKQVPVDMPSSKLPDFQELTSSVLSAYKSGWRLQAMQNALDALTPHVQKWDDRTLSFALNAICEGHFHKRTTPNIFCQQLIWWLQLFALKGDFCSNLHLITTIMATRPTLIVNSLLPALLDREFQRMQPPIKVDFVHFKPPSDHPGWEGDVVDAHVGVVERAPGGHGVRPSRLVYRLHTKVPSKQDLKDGLDWRGAHVPLLDSPVDPANPDEFAFFTRVVPLEDEDATAQSEHARTSPSPAPTSPARPSQLPPAHETFLRLYITSLALARRRPLIAGDATAKISHSKHDSQSTA